MPITFTEQLSAEYTQLFNTCQINPNKFATVDQTVKLITNNQQRYHIVGTRLSIPWYFIGVIHSLEASCNFTRHLHNGDPLTDFTKNVPKDRPKIGTPPFTWEDSATDALAHKKLDQWTNWTIPGMLFQLERYNGFGYRPRAINSPYLWSFSNHYTKGKFTADGIFSETAVSKQCGAATLLRRMSEQQIITLQKPITAQIRELGELVNFAPSKFSDKALALQKLLNVDRKSVV